MTDNEIIKALECCKTASCSICPCFKNNLGIVLCQSDLTHSALDLINRYQTEIERLTEKNNALNGNTEKYIAECEKRSREIAEDYRKEIKSEAIKEFAKRYKNEINNRYEDIAYKDLFFKAIDDIVKELTESEVS